MNRHRTLQIFILSVLIISGSLIGCGENPDPGGGHTTSETHWLTWCDSDDACSGSLMCLCGVCSLPCDGDDACGVESTCMAAESPASEWLCQSQGEVLPAAGLCLPPCEQDAECGDGYRCLAGACFPGCTNFDTRDCQFANQEGHECNERGQELCVDGIFVENEAAYALVLGALESRGEDSQHFRTFTENFTFCGAAVETCDGVDNDCDGVADNAAVDAGEVCNVGGGACGLGGVLVCDQGALVCSEPTTTPPVSRCGGGDEDCDGVVDDFDLRDVSSASNRTPPMTSDEPDHWSALHINGVDYVAYDTPGAAGGSEITLLALYDNGGREVLRVSGRSPLLFQTKSASELDLFFISDSVDEEIQSITLRADPSGLFVYDQACSDCSVCISCEDAGAIGDLGVPPLKLLSIVSSDEGASLLSYLRPSNSGDGRMRLFSARINDDFDAGSNVREVRIPNSDLDVIQAELVFSDVYEPIGALIERETLTTGKVVLVTGNIAPLDGRMTLDTPDAAATLPHLIPLSASTPSLAVIGDVTIGVGGLWVAFFGAEASGEPAALRLQSYSLRRLEAPTSYIEATLRRTDLGWLLGERAGDPKLTAPRTVAQPEQIDHIELQWFCEGSNGPTETCAQMLLTFEETHDGQTEVHALVIDAVDAAVISESVFTGSPMYEGVEGASPFFLRKQGGDGGFEIRWGVQISDSDDVYLLLDDLRCDDPEVF